MICSHVLLWVADLPGAVRDFREAGFEVHYATAEEKAKHAHIWFADGPIIELLTTPKSARFFRIPIDLAMGRGAGRRMTRWPRGGEGFCDIAFVTDDIHAELAGLADDGIPCGRSVRWKRTKPDGSTATFRFAYPRDDRLPFLVTPYDPVQHPPEIAHPNGATGIARVRLGARPEHIHALRRIAGSDPLAHIESATTTGVLGVEIAGLSEPLRLRGADIANVTASSK